MKTLLSILLMFLVSCGQPLPVEDENAVAGNIGSTLNIEEASAYDQADVNIADKICSLVRGKEDRLERDIIRLNKGFAYIYKQKECEAGEDDESITSEEFTAAVKESGQEYSLDVADSKYFRKLHTNNAKPLVSVCGKVKVGESRIDKANSDIVYQYRFARANKFCAGSDSYCLFVDVAYKNDNGVYKIKDTDLYKFSSSEDLPVKGLAIKVSSAISRVCSSDKQYMIKTQDFIGVRDL